MLDTQVAAWNRGELAGFLATYWQSPSLTMLGANGLTRGIDATAERYRAGYPDRAAMGQLAFELLECRPLGERAALVLGRYRLAGEKPQEGFFTLVLERTPRGVVIVHDHTTARPEDAR